LARVCATAGGRPLEILDLARRPTKVFKYQIQVPRVKNMKTTLKLVKPKKAKRFFARKLEFTTGPIELNYWLDQGANIQVVDVRAPADYARGHIPGAIPLPKEKWGKPAGLKKDKINVLYCYSQVCHLAAAAACEFAGRGYPVMELEGGFETWKDYELPVKKGAPARQAKKAAKSGGRNSAAEAENSPELQPAGAENESAPAPQQEPAGQAGA
jgi:rhodanese-related sulfurtransferase